MDQILWEFMFRDLQDHAHGDKGRPFAGEPPGRIGRLGPGNDGRLHQLHKFSTSTSHLKTSIEFDNLSQVCRPVGIRDSSWSGLGDLRMTAG
jgi:hypothetical protein